MSLFKKDEKKQDQWSALIDEQHEKLKTYESGADYNKGLELLVQMKEEQNKDLTKVEDKMSTKDKVETGIQIAGLGVSVFGIISAIFLGVGSYRAEENQEMCHSKMWNSSSKLMDKFSKPKS